MLEGKLHHRVVVELPGLTIRGVGDDVVALAGDVELRAVRQVSPFGEVHPHHGVTRLNERFIHGEVRRRAGEGLHVGVDPLRRPVGGGEALRCAAPGKGLYQIRHLRPLVEAPIGVASVLGKLHIQIRQIVG